MRQLIEFFPVSHYAAVGIFIFLGMFLFILFWAFYLESRHSMNERAQLPLRDEKILKEVHYE